LRTIEWTGQFKKDYRRESKGALRETLDDMLFPVVERLASDLPLAPRFRDRPLGGQFKAHRDCHIRPDLVLIYQTPDSTALRLVRLGSHSELGL
jgi:mRNA interferase YafQ